MRLDKRLAQGTGLSRKQVKHLLKAGRVHLNQELVIDPSLKVAAGDQVLCDGESIPEAQKRYLMLHKPEGYLCANSDGEHSTVMDLVELPNTNKLQIVGRLDLDTTGLLLLTDDGQWNHRITSPNRNCYKTYVATLAESITTEAMDTLSKGITLQGETRPTSPAVVEALETNRVKIKIKEGRYHQVKRMFAAVNNRVLTLHRQAIGSIVLDPDLPPGQYRSLRPDEIEHFR